MEGQLRIRGCGRASGRRLKNTCSSLCSVSRRRGVGEAARRGEARRLHERYTVFVGALVEGPASARRRRSARAKHKSRLAFPPPLRLGLRITLRLCVAANERNVSAPRRPELRAFGCRLRTALLTRRFSIGRYESRHRGILHAGYKSTIAPYGKLTSKRTSVILNWLLRTGQFIANDSSRIP